MQFEKFKLKIKRTLKRLKKNGKTKKELLEYIFTEFPFENCPIQEMICEKEAIFSEVWRFFL